jgi:L-ribulose-5-phosphate 3-epimerase
MNIGGYDIGVCSWSLKPEGTAQLIYMVKQLGLAHVQLALEPLLSLSEEARATELAKFRDHGLGITAGMIGFPGEDYSSIAIIRQTGGFMPSDLYEKRRVMTFAAGRICNQAGVVKLTSHIGFVPNSSHPTYETMVKRVSEIAAALGDMGLEFGMETGQESAPELLQFLNDLSRKNVFVNFDPANMILYGAGDPIEAVKTLGQHVRHVHIKDAVLSKAPGTVWGEEVPFGAGQVGAADFLAALNQINYTGPLVIEREAGEQRLADVAIGIKTIQSVLG